MPQEQCGRRGYARIAAGGWLAPDTAAGARRRAHRQHLRLHRRRSARVPGRTARPGALEAGWAGVVGGRLPFAAPGRSAQGERARRGRRSGHPRVGGRGSTPGATAGAPIRRERASEGRDVGGGERAASEPGRQRLREDRGWLQCALRLLRHTADQGSSTQQTTRCRHDRGAATASTGGPRDHPDCPGHHRLRPGTWDNATRCPI